MAQRLPYCNLESISTYHNYLLFQCFTFCNIVQSLLIEVVSQNLALGKVTKLIELNGRLLKSNCLTHVTFFISLICLKANWLGWSFWSQYFDKASTDIAGRLTYVVLVSEYLSRWDPNMFCVMPNICSWVQNIFPSWVQVKSKLLVLLWAVGINGQTTQDETEWILQIIKCIFFPFFLLFKT